MESQIRIENEMSNTPNLRVGCNWWRSWRFTPLHFLAADLGMKVTLIDPESESRAAVCLYRGCIPSKALLHVAKLLEEAEQAKKLGHRIRRAQG